MFESKNAKRLEYLEEERGKLWNRVLELERKVEEKPSDIEREARLASKKQPNSEIKLKKDITKLKKSRI